LLIFQYKMTAYLPKFISNESFLFYAGLFAGGTVLYLFLRRFLPGSVVRLLKKFHAEATLIKDLRGHMAALLGILYVIFLAEFALSVSVFSAYARPVLGYHIIDTESFSLSLSSIVTGIIVFYFLLVVTKIFVAMLRMYLLHKEAETAIASNLDMIVYNLSLVVIAIVTLSTIGLSWRVILPITGGLGIGVGLGLRDIANNFISGFVILTTRSIKRGDWIALGENFGKIVAIGIRTSTLRTLDNIDVIIPNSDLVTKELINWSYSDNIVRIHIPVGVSYGSDVNLVKETLLETAGRYKHARREPEPEARFIEFGDSSLNFELLVWVDIIQVKIPKAKSELNYMIWDAFREKGIQIPFPQRDVWFRNELRMDKS
jgi:small-conductance mechanosensitive channel